MFDTTTNSTSLHLRVFPLAFAIVLMLAFSFIAQAGDGHRCDGSMETCVNKLVTKLQSKAWLGVETSKLDNGFYKIAAVHEGSPAAEAGLQVGDVLVTLNGVKMHADNKKAFKKAKRALGPGVTATYVVKRSGTKQQVAVTLGSLPEERIAQIVGEHVLSQYATERVASVR